LEQLHVSVEVRPELGSDALRDSVLAAVGELVADLGIPAEPSVSIEPAPDLAEGAAVYRVQIDGRSCAQAPTIGTVDAAGLADAIAFTIAANRELLLTPSIAGSVHRAWSSESPLVAQAGLSPEAFAGVLADLLRRCVSVAPRELGDSVSHAHVDSADGFCESVLDAWNGAAVTVFVQPQHMEPPTRDASTTQDYDLSTIGTTLQEVFVDELGLILPEIEFVADPELTDGRFRVQVNDLRFPKVRGLLPDEVLVTASVDDLVGRGLDARFATNPAHGGAAAVAVIDDATLAALRAEYLTVEPRAYVVFTVRRLLRALAGALLLADVLMFQLGRLRDDDGAVLEAALARFDRYLLTAVFRRLLDEQVPIRNAVGILEGMLAIGSSTSIDQSRYEVIAPDLASIWSAPSDTPMPVPEGADYAECVRRHLRWHITRELADDDDRLQGLTVDRRLESRIRRPSPPLDEEERARLRESVWSVYEPFARAGTGITAVTNSEVRRELRVLLEHEFPDLRVLGRQEIAPDAEIKWNGEIAWA
jgi:type III secretory pathway component EscV